MREGDEAMFPLLAAKLWKLAAIALLIAAAAGDRALLLHERDAAQAAGAHLSASLADAEASNAALQSAIATQNSAVSDARGARTGRAGGGGARARQAMVKDTAA